MSVVAYFPDARGSELTEFAWSNKDDTLTLDQRAQNHQTTLRNVLKYFYASVRCVFDK